MRRRLGGVVLTFSDMPKYSGVRSQFVYDVKNEIVKWYNLLEDATAIVHHVD